MPKVNRKVVALVLAAGSSRRMGKRNKLLEPVDETPIISSVVNAVHKSSISECIVVTGFEAKLIENALANYDVKFVFNSNYAAGLSRSLHVGISALPTDTEVVLVLLGDMPKVSSKLIDKLVSCFSVDRGREICIPVYRGRRGNPVLWGRRFFKQLLETEGDKGGRQLLDDVRAWIYECEVNDSAVLTDFDTPEQFARINLSSVPTNDSGS